MVDGFLLQADEVDAAIGAENFLTVQRVRMSTQLGWTAGLMFNYSRDPFVLVSCVAETNCDEPNAQNTQNVHVVQNQFAFDLMGSINPLDRLQVGLKVPLVVRLEGTNVELGKQMLAESGLNIVAAADMADGAQKVVAAASAFASDSFPVLLPGAAQGLLLELARERLLDAMAAPGLRDVMCLGGDVHRHVAAQLRRRPDDPRSPIVAAEFVTSSITSRGIAEPLMTAIRASNPDLLHARSDERGYTFLEVTPQAVHADFRATPYPAQPGAALYSQARFSVEAGQPGVVRD